MPHPTQSHTQAPAKGPIGTHADHANHASEQDFARDTIREQARAVLGLVDHVGPSFHKAVDLICTAANAGGSVLVTGLGKSGLVGAKIAATMSSVGIPAHVVHPTEAAHGDLGRFRAADVVIAISFSGETDELVNLAAILRQDGLPIISITGGGGAGDDGTPRSSLERLATVFLRLGVTSEATPEFHAPTSSTTATLVLGDALALAAARRREFTHADFVRRHPGGALGNALRPVTDVLRFVVGKNLATLNEDLSVRRALEKAAEHGRRPGAMLVVSPGDGSLSGIFTDGDLRRLVLRDAKELDRPIAEVMTRKPRTLSSSALVRDAVLMVREHRQDEIPVVDEAGRPVGILDVQDLIALRLVQD